MLKNYRMDPQIYLECVLNASATSCAANLLLTDDHRFFRAFVKSAEAEAVLLHLCSTTLEVAHPVHLKVLIAGELIPGV